MKYAFGVALTLALTGCSEGTESEQNAVPSADSEYAEASYVSEADSTDCEGQARALAIGLCVNRTMHFIDGRSELNGTMEAEKLNRSCEPYHASKVMEGYEVATSLISEYAGQQDVSEIDIQAACTYELM